MNKITVETIVKAPLDKVWKCWNEPEHITHWAFASNDWEAPHAENDVRVGGRFKTTMAAKDKSTSFEFTGTYTVVEKNKFIEYDMDKALNEDVARHVKVEFVNLPEGVNVIESFDTENENSDEMQRKGWQAILDNFKRHVEDH